MTPRGITPSRNVIMGVASYKYKVWLVQQQHLCTAGRNNVSSVLFTCFPIALYFSE